MAWMNLDLEAAKVAEELAQGARRALDKAKAEKLVRQASSVLAHQGLSAYFLHLKAEGPKPQNARNPKPSRPDERWAEEMARQSYGLLRRGWGENPLESIAWEPAESLDHGKILRQADTRLANVGRFSEDLPRLMGGKQLVEQMLVYLRYHTKTLRKKEGS